ncbi:MAG: hypothetical protein JNG84_00640, partial [Archangium sp.]|nr:hypothetical protein [Archangium sp.]
TVDKPASIQKLARSTKAGFVVVLDGTKSGTLSATIYDPNGRTQAKPLSAKNADELAPLVAKELIELSKKTAAPVAEAPKDEPTVAPPPVEDEVSEPVTEFAAVEKKSMFDERRTKPRIGVAVGPGGVMRSLSVSGEAAETLAELRNGGTPGIGVYAHINPLQFIAATEGKKWSDLELEVHWRRSFTAATGVSGGVEGQSCSMTDDDLQLRGTYRYRLTDGTYAPSVGLGGGFSQERTVFACDLPVISTVYRGIDAQLRVRQPVFKDVLSLDVAVGPRFLFAGPSANPGFTVAGEAWLEAKPISFLFARGGGRLSRIQASDNAGLAVVDTRMFFGVEVGAFF